MKKKRRKDHQQQFGRKAPRGEHGEGHAADCSSSHESIAMDAHSARIGNLKKSLENLRQASP